MTVEEREFKKASEMTWELQGCSLIFPRGHDGEILLGYGCQADQEVSEGHFTNMISAASASETGSSSSVNEDESEKEANGRNSDTSLESRTSLKTGDTVYPYDYSKKHLAMVSHYHLDTRRVKTLHTAWDVPHRAHGPDQPGYRGLATNTTPTPDWDLEHVAKPWFATREEASGLLDKFNEDYEAKEGTKSEKMIDERAFWAPRRPIGEDTFQILGISARRYMSSPSRYSSLSHQIGE